VLGYQFYTKQATEWNEQEHDLGVYLQLFATNADGPIPF